MDAKSFEAALASYSEDKGLGLCECGSLEPTTSYLWKSAVEVSVYCGDCAPPNAVKLELPVPFQPENLMDTVSRLRGPGLARLRSLLSPQFGIRLQSTGEAAFPDPVNRIIFQTLDASPANPYLVTFDQHILDPFTGPGQFDLVERDSDDVDVFDEEWVQVSGGESEATIATKAGFPDGATTGGWSRIRKVITVDKTYSVVFVPGTAGDGIFSISAQTLYHTDPIPPSEDL